MQKIDSCQLCVRGIHPQKKPGVYAIRNDADGKMYVGSSVNVLRRLCFHRSRLASGKHFNRHLQNAWNKLGESGFSFHLIESCTANQLEPREDELIRQYRVTDRSTGYNKSDNAYASMRGRKGVLSPLYGRKRPESAMKAMREAGKGVRHYASKSVLQIDDEGNVVKRWDYISEAAEALGLVRGNISKSCMGKIKTSGGFRWRYADAA